MSILRNIDYLATLIVSQQLTAENNEKIAKTENILHFRRHNIVNVAINLT